MFEALPHYTVTTGTEGRTMCKTLHVTSATDLANGLSQLPQYRDTPVNVNRIDGLSVYRCFTVRNGQIVAVNLSGTVQS